MNSSFHLEPGTLTLDDCRHFFRQHQPIRLSDNARGPIAAARQTVDDVIAQGRTVYGINTGFGLLANTRIAPDQLTELQHSIVLSHAAGIGEFMEEATVRLMMLLKINSLARGYSGVGFDVIAALITLFNRRIWPAVPQQGSVGASGDLAPLAHMSAVLLGEGEVFIEGQRYPAKYGLAQAGIKVMTLAPKEGLALLNGTQASTAFALQGVFYTESALLSAIGIGALTVDAAAASRVPFDARIHQVRGHCAQTDIAQAYRRLLASSGIGQAHAHCDKVQDPYSVRCQPQVMGAVLHHLRHSAATIVTEANGVSDNPLVFAVDASILSGGNFHAQIIAMSADMLAIALSEIAALSERRTALLVDSTLSGLPAFLVNNGGVNSGFMIAQVTAAALASENKTLAHPASVDSLPTSANQEDHVSMATFAARRLATIYQNVAGVLAIEWLAASQGIDFRAPLKTSEPLQKVQAMLRCQVPFYAKDRYFAPDIAAATSLVQSHALADFIRTVIKIDIIQ